jgi:hypothetical protein
MPKQKKHAARDHKSKPLNPARPGENHDYPLNLKQDILIVSYQDRKLARKLRFYFSGQLIEAVMNAFR